MNKYEVEVEVCYVFGVEAEDERSAQIIAQMNLSNHAPYLECRIASIYVEKMEPETVPTEHVQRDPPGMCSGISLTP